MDTFGAFNFFVLLALLTRPFPGPLGRPGAGQSQRHTPVAQWSQDLGNREGGIGGTRLIGSSPGCPIGSPVQASGAVGDPPRCCFCSTPPPPLPLFLLPLQLASPPASPGIPKLHWQKVCARDAPRGGARTGTGLKSASMYPTPPSTPPPRTHDWKEVSPPTSNTSAS